jgi:hypothetical protein
LRGGGAKRHNAEAIPVQRSIDFKTKALRDVNGDGTMTDSIPLLLLDSLTPALRSKGIATPVRSFRPWLAMTDNGDKFLIVFSI